MFVNFLTIIAFTVSYIVFKFYFRLFYGLFCTCYNIYWWSYGIDMFCILWVITPIWIWQTQNKLNWTEVNSTVFQAAQLCSVAWHTIWTLLNINFNSIIFLKVLLTFHSYYAHINLSELLLHTLSTLPSYHCS